MSAPAKALLIILIPSLTCLHYYLTDLDGNAPMCKYLQNPTSNKFGSDYQLYLVDAEDAFNNDWWQWSFRNKYLGDKDDKTITLSNEFGSLTSWENLKDKCKEVYGKDTKTELKGSNDSDGKTRYGRDAWRYCSIFEEKPHTIEDNSGTGKSDEENLKTGKPYKDKLGETKKSELVSVTDTSKANEHFWRVREEEFFGVAEADGIGKYNTTDRTDDNGKKNMFDKLYDDKKVYKVGALKEKCEEAYKQESSTTDGKVKDNEVIKYCGLKASAPTAAKTGA